MQTSNLQSTLPTLIVPTSHLQGIASWAFETLDTTNIISDASRLISSHDFRGLIVRVMLIVP